LDIPEGPNHDVREQWHGLDSDVDTEEEVELLIRFFPSILTESDGVHSGCLVGPVTPMLLLFTEAKAVSFLPLFLKLGVELHQEIPVACHFWHLLLVPGKQTFAERCGKAYAYAVFGDAPLTAA
jgi:hypothetical protein